MSIPGQFNTLAMFSTQTSNFKFILLFHIWISSSLCLPAPFQNFHIIPPSTLWLLTSSHGEPRTDQSPSDIYPFFYMRHRTPSHVTLSNLTHLLWHNIQQPGCCLWISGPDHICTIYILYFTRLCPDQQYHMASPIECTVYLCAGLYFICYIRVHWPAVGKLNKTGLYCTVLYYIGVYWSILHYIRVTILDCTGAVLDWTVLHYIILYHIAYIGLHGGQWPAWGDKWQWESETGLGLEESQPTSASKPNQPDWTKPNQ